MGRGVFLAGEHTDLDSQMRVTGGMFCSTSRWPIDGCLEVALNPEGSLYFEGPSRTFYMPMADRESSRIELLASDGNPAFVREIDFCSGSRCSDKSAWFENGGGVAVA